MNGFGISTTIRTGSFRGRRMQWIRWMVSALPLTSVEIVLTLMVSLAGDISLASVEDDMREWGSLEKWEIPKIRFVEVIKESS
jgi:hypothetical protein